MLLVVTIGVALRVTIGAGISIIPLRDVQPVTEAVLPEYVYVTPLTVIESAKMFKTGIVNRKYIANHLMRKRCIFQRCQR